MKSWKTTLLGIVSILFGIWTAHVHYVPTAQLYFNICYVWPSSIGLIMAGIGLIYARDHSMKN